MTALKGQKCFNQVAQEYLIGGKGEIFFIFMRFRRTLNILRIAAIHCNKQYYFIFIKHNSPNSTVFSNLKANLKFSQTVLRQIFLQEVVNIIYRIKKYSCYK